MNDKFSFESKRIHALEVAKKRLSEVYSKCPEIEAIDKELSETGMKIFKTAFLPENKRDAEFNTLSDMIRFLNEKRNNLLINLGYPEDYTEPHFECKRCSDTGYVGHKMCECYKTYLMHERAQISGLGKYLTSQSFDTFNLDYYPKQLSGTSPYDTMKYNLIECRKFADNFDAQTGESLLFMGKTGLGKTHLSTAVAKRVLERGFSVVYDSAQNILAVFERERFSQSEKKQSDKYFNCDLLIVDDLGSEIRGTTSSSYFYTLINTRLVTSKSVIISTNLTPAELSRQYEERLVSRLFGEYTVLTFNGKDIRQLKKVGDFGG